MSYSRIPSRSFNTLVYDHSRNQVTKRSTATEKLRDEIRWYLQVPRPLHPFLPEIYDYSLEDELYVTMAWIRLPTVHQLYMEQAGAYRQMEEVFQSMQDVIACMSDYSTSECVARVHLEDMYVRKTMRRLDRMRKQQEWVQRIYMRGNVVLNGRSFPCPIRYLETHTNELDCLLDHSLPRIIHGDLCFPNLLYNGQQRRLVMIDPRGSFGNQSIYGDGRYDLAKVRHSLSGYDSIIADRFHVNLFGDELTIELSQSREQAEWQIMWDEWCASSLSEIRLIEALLFLSMAALHADHPGRQMAMYGLGTKLLYETLGE